MRKPIGAKTWVIAEGYIPGESHGPEPQMTSHETVCLLNCSDKDAHVEITIYYKDREPVGPYRTDRVSTENPACAIQRSSRTGDDPQRHGLFERHRIRCADRRAAYAARFSPGEQCVAQHRRLSKCGISTASIS